MLMIRVTTLQLEMFPCLYSHYVSIVISQTEQNALYRSVPHYTLHAGVTNDSRLFPVLF
jgi:hypothetical protein